MANKTKKNKKQTSTVKKTIVFVLSACNRRDGVVVRASAPQLMDLGFIPLVVLYQDF